MHSSFYANAMERKGERMPGGKCTRRVVSGLSLCVCVCVTFNTTKKKQQLRLMLLLCSIVVVVVCLPV